MRPLADGLLVWPDSARNLAPAEAEGQVCVVRVSPCEPRTTLPLWKRKAEHLTRVRALHARGSAHHGVRSRGGAPPHASIASDHLLLGILRLPEYVADSDSQGTVQILVLVNAVNGLSFVTLEEGLIARLDEYTHRPEALEAADV